MDTLESRIDELYQLPLDQFTAARNALAKTLGGDEGRLVRGLAKPAVVPWMIDQLYWKARPLYDRLMKSGDRLRAAQISALKGRSADVRAATAAHRAALAETVQKASELAGAAGSHPSADVLVRMLEALSLSGARPDHPGRLTEVLQPAGFEALSGITPTGKRVSETGPKLVGPVEKRGAKHDLADRVREERAEAKLVAQQRKAELEVKAGERALERARAVESQARGAFDDATGQVQERERELFAVRARLRAIMQQRD